MARWLLITSLFVASITSAFASVSSPTQYYGAGLCNSPEFKCIKVKRGQTWKRLFPDERERDLVQRLNRSDTYVYSGRKLIVPKNLSKTTLFDVSPFPLSIKSPKEKLIIVNQDLLAWGAYNADGKLQKWGPISSGRDYCKDINRACRTTTGIYYVFHKKGANCKSNTFPVGRGGSRMPYCMFFYKGYALHGSKEVFGRRASHGCVRLFTKDAKWLNKNFVKVANDDGHLGTKVIIQRITSEKRVKK